MDGQDWGELLAILTGNLLGLVLCTYVIGRFLSETRLPRWKVVLATLFLGHIAASLVRMLGGPSSKWSALGFTISRVAGLPLLGLWSAFRFGAGGLSGQAPTVSRRPAMSGGDPSGNPRRTRTRRGR